MSLMDLTTQGLLLGVWDSHQSIHLLGQIMQSYFEIYPYSLIPHPLFAIYSKFFRFHFGSYHRQLSRKGSLDFVSSKILTPVVQIFYNVCLVFSILNAGNYSQYMFVQSVISKKFLSHLEQPMTNYNFAFRKAKVTLTYVIL